MAWRAEGIEGRDLAAALAGAAGAFALYAMTACRTIFTGDSAELAAAAAGYGVPHPPGYPFYTLLTALWVHLFPIAQRAFAANLASSIHSAVAVSLTFLLARRLGSSRAGAGAAAIALGLGRTLWGQSIAAEVYALDLLLLVGSAHAAWSLGRSDSRRAWFVAGVVGGLWLGHRFINLAYIPALALLACAARVAGPAQSGPPASSKARLFPRWGPLIGGLVLSMLPYLYLPLASAANPYIDIGDPQTLERFWAVVRGAPYARHLAGTTPALALGRIGRFGAALPVESGIAAFLAVIGAVSLWRQRGRRWASAAMLVLLATNQILASLYNIIDIRVYWLPSLLALVLLSASGADTLLRAVPARRRALAGVLLLAVSATGLAANLRADDAHAACAARQRAADLLDSVPPEALLLVDGDTVTHSVWFLQAIERRAPGVMIVSLGAVSDWYFEQLRARYRGDPIPAADKNARPQLLCLRLLETVGRSRPVCFGFDPGEMMRLTAGAWWGERTIIPVGLALQAFPKDPPPDREAVAAANIAFWSSPTRRRPPLAPAADFETRMIGLDYALALQRTAEFLERRGLNDDAAELYRAVLALRPARWERDLIAAYRTIGRSVPVSDLESRARQALRVASGETPHP